MQRRQFYSKTKIDRKIVVYNEYDEHKNRSKKGERMRTHVRKIGLYLLLLLITEELIIRQQTQSIAPAIALAPLAYEAILISAAAVSSLYSAYVISQLSEDLLAQHSFALPSVAKEIRDHLPKTSSTAAHTHYHDADITNAIVNQITDTFQFLSNDSGPISKAHEEEIINVIKTTIIPTTVDRICSIATPACHKDSVSYPNPSSAIHITHCPNTMRIDIPHINTYASIRVMPHEELSPVKQALIAESQEWAMKTAVHQYFMEHDPYYVQDFMERYNMIMGVFYDLVDTDIHKATAACFVFPHLIIEEPYNYMLQQVIDELIPLYYDTDGRLIHIHANDLSARNFIVAKFLKNGLTYDRYISLLKQFKFHEVLDHEEEIETYLWNGFYHFVTGGWLPSINWYPHDIKKRIQENAYNTNLQYLQKLCSNHDFVKADELVHRREYAAWRMLFDESYQAFKAKYCDEYGILKIYGKDPLWLKMLADDKEEFKKNIKAATQFNNALSIRLIEKNALQKAWGIAESAPSCVHNALYELIDYVGTGTRFIAKTTALLLDQMDEKDRRTLQEALYLPSGILKDFCHFNQPQPVFPQDMFEYRELLQEINMLWLEQYNAKDTQAGELARIAFAQIQALLDPTMVSESIITNAHESATSNVSLSLLQDIALLARKEIESELSHQAYELIKPALLTAAVELAHWYMHAIDSLDENDEGINTFFVPLDPPLDKNDWPKNKANPWTPPHANWTVEEARAYITFFDHVLFCEGFASMGITIDALYKLFETSKDKQEFLISTSMFQQLVISCYKTPILEWSTLKECAHTLFSYAT